MLPPFLFFDVWGFLFVSCFPWMLVRAVLVEARLCSQPAWTRFVSSFAASLQVLSSSHP